jgi:ferredoxin
MAMQITVNTPACIGAGQCVMAAEDLFDQDDDGIVMLLDASPDAAHEAVARRAASLCPARAIKLTE